MPYCVDDAEYMRTVHYYLRFGVSTDRANILMDKYVDTLVGAWRNNIAPQDIAAAILTEISER